MITVAAPAPPQPAAVPVSQFARPVYIVPTMSPQQTAAHQRMMYVYILLPIGLALLGGISSAVAQCNARHAAESVSVPRPVAPPKSPSPITTPTAPVVLTTNQSSYTQKETVVVSYQNMPANTHAWISIARVGANSQNYITFKYVDTSNGTVSFPLAGVPPGRHYTRAYADSGYTLIGEAQFTITAK